MDRFALVALAALLLLGCEKGNGSDGSRDGHDTGNWCYDHDSSCMMIPNVFTPNADGINDNYGPVTYWIAEGQVVIRDLQMREVYRSSNILDHWTGNQPDGTPCGVGIYLYDISAVSTSGDDVRRVGHLHLLRDLQEDRIQDGCEVILSDMLDPRRCGDLLPSNEQL
jgi:CHU_C Type IX secretion signal domain